MVRARLTAPSDPAVVSLGGGQSIGAVWMIASSATGQLAPGDYHVQARLIIREGRGWKGEAASEAIPLRVVPASAERNRAVQFALARAQEAALAGALPEAAGLIDALLATEPNDIRLLTARAALCVRAGDYRSARVCVNRAIASLEGSGGKYPPVGLFELESEISSALIKFDPASATPPAWTRPPASVLAPEPAERLPGNVPVQASTGSIPAAAPAPVVPVALTTFVVESTRTPVLKIERAASAVVVPSSELVDAKIIADAAGQWAASATASSQYGNPRYSAAQATGAPNIPLGMAGDNPDAWSPASKNDGTAWLELTFARPVQATEVRVRQNNVPGAIAKVEVIDDHGATHLWWEGADPYRSPSGREIAWFAVRVSKTSYAVARVKLTLNLAAGSGYKQIDAVQLVASGP
jgi:hypothetical protein